MPNAVFGVWDDPKCDESDKRPLATLTTGANGVSQTYVKKDIKSTVSSITLYCKELKAPDGYVKTDEIYSLTFNKSEYDKLYATDSETEGQLQTFGGTGIVNPHKEWSVSAWTKKVDKSGNPLAGAKFGIYDNEACTGEPYATIKKQHTFSSTLLFGVINCYAISVLGCVCRIIIYKYNVAGIRYVISLIYLYNVFYFIIQSRIRYKFFSFINVSIREKAISNG